MQDKEKECPMCDGRGYMTNENYVTGDCITCEGSGFLIDTEDKQSG